MLQYCDSQTWLTGAPSWLSRSGPSVLYLQRMEIESLGGHPRQQATVIHRSSFRLHYIFKAGCDSSDWLLIIIGMSTRVAGRSAMVARHGTGSTKNASQACGASLQRTHHLFLGIWRHRPITPSNNMPRMRWC